MRSVNSTKREILWLRRVRDVAQDLADETDLDVVLPRILDAAIEITEAERAYLVRITGKKSDGDYSCKVVSARGFQRDAIEGRAGAVSRTVVERVLDTGEGLVTTREEDADVLDASSVQASRVLSIICVPLNLRGELCGVLYLDHRFRPEAFTEADLPILRTFADQAALGLETADLRADADRLNESLRELDALRAQAAERGEHNEAGGSEPRLPVTRFGKLVGDSVTMCALYEEIERAARSWDPVLLIGESGSGKGLVAAEVHARSELPRQPFLVQSCTAVSEDQLEAELFGRSATGPQQGALLRAERGTLVLRDVEDLSPALQGKLAGVLRDRALTTLGSSTRAPVACRIIAVSRQDLRARVADGTFREDLYYRLDVQRIAVPALRDRPNDLAGLVAHFVLTLGGSRLLFTDNAMSLLRGYSWPGNVRELGNEVRRLMNLDASEISARQLSDEVRAGRGLARGAGDTAGKTLGEVEREMILAAVADAKGNKARAARQLGIPRSTLYGLIQRHRL